MDFESDFEVPYSDDASRLAKQERLSMKRKLPKWSGVAALVLLAGALGVLACTVVRISAKNPKKSLRNRIFCVRIEESDAECCYGTLTESGLDEDL